jgi:tRNA (cytidine/uridine-2'-O-)-methyltransferase
VRLALFQPDIADNVAGMMRLSACLDLPLDLIEPFGFVLDPVRLRRVGLDYAARAEIRRHGSFDAFERERRSTGRRLVLLTTQAPASHLSTRFAPDDVLMAGRESAGVPDAVHAAADLRVRIPIRSDCRSLNVVTALAIVAGEALRQCEGFPPDAA